MYFSPVIWLSLHSSTGLARCAVGASAPHPRGDKKFRRNLITRKICKCTPRQSKSQFLRTSLLGGEDLESLIGSFSSFSLCFEVDD